MLRATALLGRRRGPRGQRLRRLLRPPRGTGAAAGAGGGSRPWVTNRAPRRSAGRSARGGAGRPVSPRGKWRESSVRPMAAGSRARLRLTLPPCGCQGHCARGRRPAQTQGRAPRSSPGRPARLTPQRPRCCGGARPSVRVARTPWLLRGASLDCPCAQKRPRCTRTHSQTYMRMHTQTAAPACTHTRAHTHLHARTRTCTVFLQRPCVCVCAGEGGVVLALSHPWESAPPPRARVPVSSQPPTPAARTCV